MARQTAQTAVALGGGHGLAATLSALRRLVADLTLDELTGVVTVADNGGSSGRLRGEFGVLPPGDLRMALAALCGSDDWGSTWAHVVQHRFAGDGDMRGHVVGNLLIVGLWELMGDHVTALDWVGRLLGCHGRVLPMAVTPMDITAEVSLDPDQPDSLTTVRGQVEVATTAGRIRSVALDPPDPVACPEAVSAIREADWVVLGPGSWFTSVIPHLLVPELRRVLVERSDRLVVVLNMAAQDGETQGFSEADHLRALHDVAPDLRVRTVLADRASVVHGHDLEEAVAALGGRLVLEDVAVGDGTARHDPELLSAALAGVMEAGGDEAPDGEAGKADEVVDGRG